MADEFNDPIIERARYWITQCKAKIKRIRYGELPAMVRSPYATYWYGSLVISPRMARDLSEDERDFAIVNAIVRARLVNYDALAPLIVSPALLILAYILGLQKEWLRSFGFPGLMLVVGLLIATMISLLFLMRWASVLEHTKRFAAVIRQTRNAEAARSFHAKVGAQYLSPIDNPFLLLPAALPLKTATRCLEKAIRVVGQ